MSECIVQVMHRVYGATDCIKPKAMPKSIINNDDLDAKMQQCAAGQFRRQNKHSMVCLIAYVMQGCLGIHFLNQIQAQYYKDQKNNPLNNTNMTAMSKYEPTPQKPYHSKAEIRTQQHVDYNNLPLSE